MVRTAVEGQYQDWHFLTFLDLLIGELRNQIFFLRKGRDTTLLRRTLTLNPQLNVWLCAVTVSARLVTETSEQSRLRVYIDGRSMPQRGR